MGLLLVLGLVQNDGKVSNVARESFYNALLGVSCGTLMGANIALPFVACLFHDVNTMTGLFIHLMPPVSSHAAVYACWLFLMFHLSIVHNKYLFLLLPAPHITKKYPRW